MGADLSRVRLNPLLDFAGVEFKQGAVLLDADANELGGILDRRLRALASDILSRATVASATPAAFEITLVGGMLQIGPGRLYVDGLLAENHGLPDPAGRRFDPLLAEPAFTALVPYDRQPYLPDPPPLPAAGRHLVHLDVWTREITYLERPDLVEPALGVETSSRLQTVWQVRVAPEDLDAAATCATPDADLPGWAALVAPSTGVLTTGTFEVAVVDDPCDLPPSGGYRGGENQLYRVEIHDGGQPGAGATFKWSRENASVGSRVTSLAGAGELELASLGRDEVLSLGTGDWVEIIDDARELAGRPGEMRKVTADEATRRIRFAPPLPADLLPPAFPDSAFPEARNLRVRRWDQRGQVFRTGPNGTAVAVQDLDAAGSGGVVAVPAAATTLLLEHGITVRFDATGPTGFRTGDVWVFAARTTDASLELLDRAPPRGLHHHHARLAIWDVAAGTLTDCRTRWPPAAGEGHDCSCAACVTPESHASGTLTIQAAVDAVARTGGTVCLGPGPYALAEPVRLAAARGVRIRGQGPTTLLATPGGAFAIADGQGVAIEDLAILSFAARPAVSVETALGLALRRLLIACPSNPDRRGAAISLGGFVGGAVLAENAILADTGLAASDPTLRDEGTEPFLVTAGLRIEDNAFWCARKAIALDAAHHLLDTRIVNNDVLTCAETAVSVAGYGLPGSSLTVSRNLMSVEGPGLRLAGESLLVEGNRLSRASGAERDASDGLALVAGTGRDGPARAQLLSNLVAGFGGTALLVAASARDLLVKLNILEGCGGGILVTDGADAAAASIENNHLRDIGAREGGEAYGIAVLRGGSAAIAGNTLLGIGMAEGRATYRTGILASSLLRARIAGNEAVGIGPVAGFPGIGAGIHLLAPGPEFEVCGNRAERDLGPMEEGDGAEWFALLVQEPPREPGVLRAGISTYVRLEAGQALAFGAGRPKLLAGSGDTRGLIHGNVLIARGGAFAVEVAATDCTFSDNRVTSESLGAHFQSQVIVVSGNRVFDREIAIVIDGANADTAAILGNVTRGGIAVSGSGLSPPWNALNILGV